MNYDAVSFPNLGIGQIKLNPTAIQITDNISIQWYAIIIVIGIIVAFFVCDRLRKRFDITSDDFLDCLLYTIPVAFIGARLTYVLGDLDSFHSFYDVIAVWNGGLAIYGGVIFAAASVFVICKIKKCDWRSMLDIMAIGLLIGQIIGRWGNFVNIEVYGVSTDLPWAMGIGYYGEGASELVHPLFLYECLWNIIGLVLIYGYMDLRKFKGEVFLWYTAWYGLGRGLMEPLRNSEYNLHLFGVRIMMILAFLLFACATIAIIILRKKSKGYIVTTTISKKQKQEKDYVNQFNTAIVTDQNNKEQNDGGDNDLNTQEDTCDNTDLNTQGDTCGNADLNTQGDISGDNDSNTQEDINGDNDSNTQSEGEHTDGTKN